jgi:hypothetical protein
MSEEAQDAPEAKPTPTLEDQLNAYLVTVNEAGVDAFWIELPNNPEDPATLWAVNMGAPLRIGADMLVFPYSHELQMIRAEELQIGARRLATVMRRTLQRQAMDEASPRNLN